MNRERRSYPRYPVTFPLEVLVPDEADKGKMLRFAATADNLSRTSIQFGCHADLVAALLRQSELPFTCDLEFTLPWDEHRFKLPAQLITHRRVSQFQYVLVLLLKHADVEQENLLDNLLGQQQTIGLD